MDRGKVLWEEDLEKTNGQWSRYLDVDGDGIPYRTVPGNRYPGSAYFGRGTGHDENAHYSEEPEVWERVIERIGRKHDTARDLVPAPVIETMEGAEIGIIAYGSTDQAVCETRALLKEKGIPTDYMRVRAVPFPKSVHDFIRDHRRVYVVEMNRDGQMRQLLSLDYPEGATRLVSVAHVDGLPLTACWIEEKILAKEEEND